MATQSVNVALDDGIIARLDALIPVLERRVPGVLISRASVARNLLLERLAEVEASLKEEEVSK